MLTGSGASSQVKMKPASAGAAALQTKLDFDAAPYRAYRCCCPLGGQRGALRVQDRQLHTQAAAAAAAAAAAGQCRARVSTAKQLPSNIIGSISTQLCCYYRRMS